MGSLFQTQFATLSTPRISVGRQQNDWQWCIPVLLLTNELEEGEINIQHIGDYVSFSAPD